MSRIIVIAALRISKSIVHSKHTLDEGRNNILKGLNLSTLNLGLGYQMEKIIYREPKNQVFL